MGLVSWLIAIPLLTAVAVVLTPARYVRSIRWIAVTGCGLHLVLTAVVSYLYWQAAAPDAASMKDALYSKLYLVERVPWFDSLGISYFVGVDGISVAMVILTSIVIFTGVLASWTVEVRVKEFFALLLLLVTGVFGVFLSFDLFLFLMFYELAVLPMYLLIGVWGTGPKEYSAMKLTLMLLVGSAFVLVGFLALYHASGLHTFDLMLLATPVLQRLSAVGVPDDLRGVRRHRGLVSAAHVVARRTQFGADGGFDAARGRPDETGRLRGPAGSACTCCPRAPRCGACCSWC